MLKSLLNSKDLTLSDLNDIFRQIDLVQIEPMKFPGKILGTIFWEPSTRTRISMEAAMLKLGGNYVSCTKSGSSSEKGETFSDTVSVIANYVDVLAIRHASEDAIVRASELCNLPIINCGSGTTDHPTQALIDLYTILREKGRINGLNILIIGDLQHARTIKSFIKLLSHYNVNVNSVSLTADLTEAQWQAHLVNADVLYMTRLHREREECSKGCAVREQKFVLNAEKLCWLRKDCIILHPMPRTSELQEDVDTNPRAKYFHQVKYGLFVRMAILQMLLGRK